jgi:hypothetical protein
MDPQLVGQFADLFQGREDAWGTGKGAVVRGHLRETHYAAHLAGWEPGLGIFPLLDDGTCRFAAVDLDKPDYPAAMAIRELLNDAVWIERSRSGNYHVWVFFDRPIEAWIPRAILKTACEGVGEPNAEIFPKQDRLMPGMVGNYINLPYHGESRKIYSDVVPDVALPLPSFLRIVEQPGVITRAERWESRAKRLGLKPQEQRGDGREQGTSSTLHICAEKIITERETNPVLAGGRHVIYFNLAKMLLDWKELDDEEAWGYLCQVESCSPDQLDVRELRRIFNNAKRGGYTSTGCDNPLMAPYVHPDCPIANGSAKG